jgi:ABC-type glycerol-3-phosphate transport system permease component
MRRSPLLSLLVHALLILGALLTLVPFAWLICAAFKPQEQIFATAFLPWGNLRALTLDNFRRLFTTLPFGRWLLNSIFLTSVQTVAVVTLSSLGGFALAKYRFRGKRLLMLVMLATLLLPAQVLLPSSYELMYQLGWINTYAALIIPGSVSVFGIFLFRQAMLSVPDELLHAGRVDGCSELRLWWEIALPIVRPTTGAYTLFAFLGAWNSFLWPQVMLQDQSRLTLPLGLASLIGTQQFETHYGMVMAGTLLSILPVAILFFALQKDFISGLSSGAVKG